MYQELDLSKSISHWVKLVDTFYPDIIDNNITEPASISLNINVLTSILK